MFWAEPSNKNPLEKTTLSREGFGAQSKELKDESAVSGLQGLENLLKLHAPDCLVYVGVYAVWFERP